jgi:hypothetical protein
MSTVRLTLTPPLKKVLDELEESLMPLSKSEIIKTAVAELYARVKKQQSGTTNINIHDVVRDIESNPNRLDLTDEEFSDWWQNLKKLSA